MEQTIHCIYCRNGTAELKSGDIKHQRGLIKNNFTSSWYECTNCKRTFHTQEQKMQDIIGATKQIKMIDITRPAPRQKKPLPPKK